MWPHEIRAIQVNCVVPVLQIKLLRKNTLDVT